MLTLGETTLQLVASSSIEQCKPLKIPVARSEEYSGQPHATSHVQEAHTPVSVAFTQSDQATDRTQAYSSFSLCWKRYLRWLQVGLILMVTHPGSQALFLFILFLLLYLALLGQVKFLAFLIPLALPLLPALGILVLSTFMGYVKREPWGMRLAAFCWGGMIAVPIAFVLEPGTNMLLHMLLRGDGGDLISSVGNGANAGIVEEALKGGGLLFLFFFLPDVLDRVTSGIVYGVLIGGGFALAENIFYFTQSPRTLFVPMIIGRIVLGWLMHSTFTACFGAALGYTRQIRGRWGQRLLPVGGYLLAVGLHSLFNIVLFQVSMTMLLMPENSTINYFSNVVMIGDYLPPFIAQMILAALFFKAQMKDVEVVQEFLGGEVSRGTVTVEEYILLQHPSRRMRHERRILQMDGVRQWMWIKALYQAEITLAFYHWHSSNNMNKKTVRAKAETEQ